MILKKENQGTIIVPKGDLGIGKVEELENRILELIVDGNYNIIIDFSQVQSIDISGLSMLLTIVNELIKRGKRLKLVNVISPGVRDMLKSIYLDDLVQIE
ncbi:MAG: STAS domain-containing protein [Halanaerobiaceae bacterium]